MQLQNFYPIVVTDKLVECRDFYVRFFDLRWPSRRAGSLETAGNGGGEPAFMHGHPWRTQALSPSAARDVHRVPGRGRGGRARAVSARRRAGDYALATRLRAAALGLFDPAGVWIDVVHRASRSGFWERTAARERERRPAILA